MISTGFSAASSMSTAWAICCLVGRGLVDGQGRIYLGIVGDIGHLHIERQVDQHRARAPFACRPEGLAHDAGHLQRLGDAPGGLAHRAGDRGNVNALEGFFAKLGAHVLAGDGDEGHGIDLGRVEAGDKIGGGGAGRADSQGHSCPTPGNSHRRRGRRLPHGGRCSA